jgi:hypothetical protein
VTISSYRHELPAFVNVTSDILTVKLNGKAADITQTVERLPIEQVESPEFKPQYHKK